MKSILFIEPFSELGGGQRNLLDLLPAILARGWKAIVAAPGSGPLFDQAREIGAQVARIGIGNYSAGKKTPADAARFALDTIALGRWVSRQPCDLICAGGARVMPGVARGARGRPVIFQAQHFLGKSYAVRMTSRAIARSRATVIANSKHVAAQFGLHPGAAHVVYNGVPEIPFLEHAFRAHPRCGIIGRIAPMKGQADFLRAAALLLEPMPGATFVICGAPMFTAKSYVDQVHRLAKNIPVEFLGWRDCVGAVLNDLDLLVAPSTEAEATTRVILEAFSAGVPVVAYSIGGIPEIVRDAETGFLVPECNPEALARRIAQISPDSLPEISRRAHREFAGKFTLNRYRREMLEIFEKVMNASENANAAPQLA